MNKIVIKMLQGTVVTWTV